MLSIYAYMCISMVKMVLSIEKINNLKEYSWKEKKIHNCLNSETVKSGIYLKEEKKANTNIENIITFHLMLFAQYSFLFISLHICALYARSLSWNLLW